MSASVLQDGRTGANTLVIWQAKSRCREQKMDRRRFVIGTAATALAAGPACAQEAYPARAVTIINAFPPGGLNDLVTRPLATAMESILKQAVVVETKAGAAGQVGAQVAASAKPDGYTLLSHNTGISGYAEVDKLFGRPVKVSRAHFIALARLIADPVLLLVNEQQPYKTLKELIEGAQAHPGTLVFSSGGLYGASHLPLGYLEKATGPLKLRHLPTAGGGPAIVAILGNNAQVTTQSVSATLPHIKSGKLRPLAIFSAARSKLLPDVPTLKELGYDVEYYLWVGIFAPKGTEQAIVTTLRAVIGQAVQSDQFKAALVNLGQELDYLDGPEFQTFWDIDGKRTDEAVIAIGRQG
jgi:tripartite-type tricarboxylate transporter receptor subunit TctC